MIVLVRHGEATHHTEHLTGGWTDSVLTEHGRYQMEKAGRSLSCYFRNKLLTTPLRILCSDLRRAQESAKIIAGCLRFRGELEPYSFLREKCNGQAANLPEIEAKKIYCRPQSEHDLNHRNYPGGETRQEFFDRTVNGVWEHVDMERENVIIVAHKGSVQNIVFGWLGMSLEEVCRHNFSIDAQPSSITILDVNSWKEHSILRLNDVSHLW